MIDSLTDFVINQNLLKQEVDPFAWELNTYTMNKRVWEVAQSRLEELGYTGEINEEV